MEYFATVVQRIIEIGIRAQMWQFCIRNATEGTHKTVLVLSNKIVDDIIKHIETTPYPGGHLVETDPDQEGTIRGTIQDPEPADSSR